MADKLDALAELPVVDAHNALARVLDWIDAQRDDIDADMNGRTLVLKGTTRGNIVFDPRPDGTVHYYAERDTEFRGNLPASAIAIATKVRDALLHRR